MPMRGRWSPPTSMTFRRLFVAVLGVGLLSAEACKKEFKEFSPDGKFKVLMQGAPREDTQFATGGEGQMGAFVKSWTVEQGDGAYSVSVTDLPGPHRPESDPVLDGAVRGLSTGVGGTVTSNSKVTLAGKYPGRAFEGTVPKKSGVMQARIYLVNDRLYQLLAIGKKSFIDSAEAARFLDSFQLLGDPGSAPAGAAGKN
jgi:hypothetical protein